MSDVNFNKEYAGDFASHEWRQGLKRAVQKDGSTIEIKSPEHCPEDVGLWKTITQLTERDVDFRGSCGEGEPPVPPNYNRGLESNELSKCLQVVRKASYYFIKGDSNIVPEEWNGIYAQHASAYPSLDIYMKSDVVIDLRGEALTQERIKEGAAVVRKYGGEANCVWGSPTVMSSIAQPPFGVSLNSDECLKKPGGKLLVPGGAIHNMAPNPPDETEPSPIEDSSSKFVANEWGALETVSYAVSAVNRYGESEFTLLNKAKKLEGSPAVLAFTASRRGGHSATGFIIYRSMVTSGTNATDGEANFFTIFSTSVPELANGYDGAPPGQVYDRNRFLPNTEEAFITEMKKEVLWFKQFAPISKLNVEHGALAPIFLLGTPVLHCPKKLVRFINIGA